jgi:hypothetical protein
MYYQLSQNISYETPDHESLVLNIIQIQGMGPLTRPVRGNYSVDIARTAEGTLWNDLPFLAQLLSGEESDDEDPKRSIRQLEIFDLLLAAVTWLRHTGSNIILLSEVYWNS